MIAYTVVDKLESGEQQLIQTNRDERVSFAPEIRQCLRLRSQIVHVDRLPSIIADGYSIVIYKANNSELEHRGGQEPIIYLEAEMLKPTHPKIYHIVHIDRLPSIIADGYLWCDSEMAQRSKVGTNIGMNRIKKRRLGLRLTSYPNLNVGDCAPFYFCPRSVMLYVIYKANNSELEYRGGQEPIIHLEADLRQTVAWANDNDRHWAFTTSNAGSSYFEDYSDLDRLNELDWNAVNAKYWRDHKEGKQAEFLVEKSFPWSLVTRIGVWSRPIGNRVLKAMNKSAHRPLVEIKADWYY